MVERETVLARRNNCNDVWIWRLDLHPELRNSIELCFSEYKVIKTNDDIACISFSDNLRFDSKFKTLMVTADTAINLLGYDKCKLKIKKQ